MLKEILSQRGLPELKTREEMLEILSSEVYGHIPPKPDKLSFKTEQGIKEGFCAGKASLNKVTCEFELYGRTGSFEFYSVIPTDGKKHPFFVSIGFLFEKTIPSIYLPAEEIIDRGFALLHLFYTDVTTDDNDFMSGIAPILSKDGERSEVGKISMWAWAASRMLDYAYTQDGLELDSAIVAGHSRLGKTALWAGANDTRFKYSYSNESGCAGAAISRGKCGESIKNIVDRFPFWFSPEYFKYSQSEDTASFDQHYLTASVAPRYAYVSSADRDKWADPDSEFLGCLAAAPAWGDNAFITEDRLPVVGDVYHEGKIGYHLRAGTHYFSREDWNKFIDFFNKKEREEKAK